MQLSALFSLALASSAAAWEVIFFAGPECSDEALAVYSVPAGDITCKNLDEESAGQSLSALPLNDQGEVEPHTIWDFYYGPDCDEGTAVKLPEDGPENGCNEFSDASIHSFSLRPANLTAPYWV